MVNEKDLIGTGKASRLLRISPQGVGLRVRVGKLRAVQIDGRNYFRRHEIERMAKRQEVAQ